MKEAVIMQNGDYTINYPKALLSYGDLRSIENVEIAIDETNEGFNLQWTNNSHQGMAYRDDRLLVVCYAPEVKRFYYKILAEQRADEEAFYPLKPSNTPVEYHIWVGFCGPDEQRASPSLYAGSLML